MKLFKSSILQAVTRALGAAKSASCVHRGASLTLQELFIAQGVLLDTSQVC